MKKYGQDMGRVQIRMRLRVKSDLGEPMVVDGPIKSVADLKNYDMASRLELEEFEALKGMTSKVGKDVAHFLAVNDPFKISWSVRGHMPT